ncbi:monofunctional biosynthetic peptidoglycan transglycosylase [Parapusillimonas granuli]|uniref:Biosynthetic peptidoglycan transglycosylase n=1 Tax=Parapusillimonas granuli TaxID=380911 RepID=A0A853G919_9BURK|nr:monofunctional biosynthetic peptidoglycan transglycosylase [Parapusillimonas granuli]MBB5215824.1 monofunctional biosynthetic peptidoglycan transglycosylase [Parapusillimonas granuli]MEB2399485.1 monofunctional biosynthetic peptidoglycan transglycosylase [Alcaligenaceae bacterium]NYT51111.1 monofunctional biosynthetic peptidoglycan transglycosylase [Parapusillimonas granuli]
MAGNRSLGKMAATALLLAFAALLLYLFGLFVMVLWLSVRDPGSSAFMRATLSELRASDPDAEIKYRWVPYENISDHLKRAVVASEDANFLDHYGVEWEAIRKAWEYNRRQAERGASRMRGGSTITQQLAKNLFLSGSRSYVRKAQELVLTYMIETVMSKRRILELYLNVAQWGTNVFGAEAAARHYYKTGADRLGAQQAARLASMLPRPAYYDEHGNTAYLNSRTSTIRKRMQLVEIPE